MGTIYSNTEDYIESYTRLNLIDLMSFDPTNTELIQLKLLLKLAHQFHGETNVTLGKLNLFNILTHRIFESGHVVDKWFKIDLKNRQIIFQLTPLIYCASTLVDTYCIFTNIGAGYYREKISSTQHCRARLLT